MCIVFCLCTPPPFFAPCFAPSRRSGEPLRMPVALALSPHSSVRGAHVDNPPICTRDAHVRVMLPNPPPLPCPVMHWTALDESGMTEDSELTSPESHSTHTATESDASPDRESYASPAGGRCYAVLPTTSACACMLACVLLGVSPTCDRPPLLLVRRPFLALCGGLIP